MHLNRHLIQELVSVKREFHSVKAELDIQTPDRFKDMVESFKRNHPEVECRTGHSIYLLRGTHAGSFKYIIVERDCATVNKITETSQKVWVHLKGEGVQDHEDVLWGAGETEEEEAWEEAALR